jgi:hypothetical protein
MKTFRIIVALLVPAMLSQAAELVQWGDLPKKIGHGKMRQYRVVLKDGLTYAGYELIFSRIGVKVVPSGPLVPREQVTEIRIHRDRNLWDGVRAPAVAILDPLCSNDELCLLNPITLLAIPVAFGLSVAAAPITLPIEGIKRLLPDRVLKVAPN